MAQSDILIIDLSSPPCGKKVMDMLAGKASAECMGCPDPRQPPIGLAGLVVLCAATWRDIEAWLRGSSSRRPPALAVVPTSESQGIETLLDAGLEDFVLSPFRECDLLARVRRFLCPPAHGGGPCQDAAPIPEDLRRQLVGRSHDFEAVLARIPKLASTDATILVTGETGTGKELVARALHYQSARKGGPFVPVNCGAMPESLIENELFGHSSGAFTDARGARRGLIAEACGGTLFLDELDALPLAAQASLLRFLQDMRYRPLGEAKAQCADVRVVAATNCDLGRAIREKRFRRDLYHRLDILRLELPALRERTGDITLLARHFLERYRSTYGGGPRRLSLAALQHLGRHDWPGNVRELEAVIHRAVLLAAGEVIQPRDLDVPVIGGARGQGESVGGETLSEAKRRVIERFEKRYLIDTLQATGGNVSQAAREAGKERSAFQRLLRKHGIDRRHFVTAA